MACSAVVIELPNGVFITTMPLRGGGGNVDIVDANAGAADDFEILRRGDDFGGHLGVRAHGEAIILADDLHQLFLLSPGLEIDLEAALLENSMAAGESSSEMRTFGIEFSFRKITLRHSGAREARNPEPRGS